MFILVFFFIRQYLTTDAGGVLLYSTRKPERSKKISSSAQHCGSWVRLIERGFPMMWYCGEMEDDGLKHVDGPSIYSSGLQFGDGDHEG